MPDPLPWFPFYGADWWNSPRVLALDPADRDAYQFLLWLQWRDGSVPAKSHDLWPLLAGNVKRASAARMLAEFFPLSEDGRRRNSKQADLLAAAVKKLDTNRSRGKAGAKARYSRTTSPTISPTTTPTMPQAELEHSELEGESERETTTSSSTRYQLPPVVEAAMGPYLTGARYPDALRSTTALLLNPDHRPHFEADLIAKCLLEMQAAGRPFNSGVLARWCQNALTPRGNMGFLDALPEPPQEAA